MGECRSCPTPAIKESGKAVSENPSADKDVASNCEHFSYWSAVGALLYLATGSRPDVAHAFGVASRNLENPSNEDFVRVK